MAELRVEILDVDDLDAPALGAARADQRPRPSRKSGCEMISSSAWPLGSSPAFLAARSPPAEGSRPSRRSRWHSPLPPAKVALKLPGSPLTRGFDPRVAGSPVDLSVDHDLGARQTVDAVGLGVTLKVSRPSRAAKPRG